MNAPQITLTDCLTEINNALNYWYPLPVRDSKLDEELGRYRPYGASREECDARHVRLFQFRDRLQEQIKQAGKAADFNLAMAMAELASVEAERDNARQSLRAAEADAAETDSVNADLRTVNARLVADLAAAMERLAHAESILMQ